MNEPQKMTVVDFFCGAGGFSEGFRQQGFKIVMGVDYWMPAIESHNLNHNLNDSTKDVLDFWGKNSSDIIDINSVPDSDVIIGSPSCVSFSMSNKAGKADKSHGVKLIEAFLRVITVKKYQKNSTLSAWYMENVPQSQGHIKEQYTFSDLNLSEWALSQNINPESVAISISGVILNAGDYGAPQSRKRFVIGEWVQSGEFLYPEQTHDVHVTLADIRSNMPSPLAWSKGKKWRDPNYSNLLLNTAEITDHFYDTGLYCIEWEKAEHLKLNHPYMGKMSFPENENKSCRTILATRSASSREALIYKSEYNRIGNGAYRLPTIREIACLMGYPLNYQFVGSESVKWKQVGNSVSPHLSSAIAKVIRKKMGLDILTPNFDSLSKNYPKIKNLNTFKERLFDIPKRRMINARFRRHPLKAANMTVDLLNYHPLNVNDVGHGWHVVAYFGTGNTHGVKIFNQDEILILETILNLHLESFAGFKLNLEKMLIPSKQMQAIYEKDLNLEIKDNPLNKVKDLAALILEQKNYCKAINGSEVFPKQQVPLSQVLAAYGLLRIANHF